MHTPSHTLSHKHKHVYSQCYLYGGNKLPCDIIPEPLVTLTLYRKELLFSDSNAESL